MDDERVRFSGFGEEERLSAPSTSDHDSNEPARRSVPIVNLRLFVSLFVPAAFSCRHLLSSRKLSSRFYHNTFFSRLSLSAKGFRCLYHWNVRRIISEHGGHLRAPPLAFFFISLCCCWRDSPPEVPYGVLHFLLSYEIPTAALVLSMKTSLSFLRRVSTHFFYWQGNFPRWFSSLRNFQHRGRPRSD